MSSRITAAIWASDLPPRLRYPALALAELADGAGRVSMPVKEIAAYTGQSERTMQTALQDLETAGAITRDEKPGRPAIYELTYAKPAPPPTQILRTTPAEIAPLELKPLPINGARRLIEAQFSEFWTAYPRKVGKPKAQTAYLNLQPDQAMHHRILRDLLERSKTAEWLKDGGAYIPHPTTYLHQHRFDDQPTDTTAPRKFFDSLPEA